MNALTFEAARHSSVTKAKMPPFELKKTAGKVWVSGGVEVFQAAP